MKLAKSNEAMNEITMKLKNNSDIDIFNFARMFKQGTRVVLRFKYTDELNST